MEYYPGSSPFPDFKLFGDLHVLVKDAVLLVAGNLPDGFSIYPRHDVVGDECNDRDDRDDRDDVMIVMDVMDVKS